MPDSNDSNSARVAESLANRFWDIANYIVGFAVLQGVLFTIALPTSDLRAEVLGKKLWPLLLTAVSAVVYVIFVELCFWSERDLRQTAKQDMRTLIVHSRRIKWMRVAAIILVNGLVALSILLLEP